MIIGETLCLSRDSNIQSGNLMSPLHPVLLQSWLELMASWQASGRCQSFRNPRWKIDEDIELIWRFNPSSMQLPSPTALFLMLQNRCTNIFRWNIVTNSFCFWTTNPVSHPFPHPFHPFRLKSIKDLHFVTPLKKAPSADASNNCEPVKSTNISAIYQVFQPVDPERYLKPWVASPGPFMQSKKDVEITEITMKIKTLAALRLYICYKITLQDEI